MKVQIFNTENNFTYKNILKKYDISEKLLRKYKIAIEVREFNFEYKNNSDIFYVKENKNSFVILLNKDADISDIINSININDEKLINEIKEKIFNYYNSMNSGINKNENYLGSTKIMGILNITPDSFSDGGKFNRREKAIEHALKMLEEGADIIDIGGESTRPGSEAVAAEEEILRVVPIITELKKLNPNLIISVDTNKAAVAEEALKAGGSIINDISGATFDENILSVCKKYEASIILMHIKGTPKDMQDKPEYNFVVEEVYDFLEKQAKKAKEYDIKNIIIDPGIGFGKSVADNYEIISCIDNFKSLGYPILIGLSKKSYLGKALNIEVSEREVATAISEAISIKNGASIIRTHNVKNAVYAKQLINFYNNPEALKNV